MEPAGLAIGILGLFGLLNSARGFAEFVNSCKSSENESRCLDLLETALKLELDRLYQSVGLYGEAPRNEHQYLSDKEEIRKLINEVSSCFKDAHPALDAHNAGPRQHRAEVNCITAPPPVHPEAGRASRWKRLRWALIGKLRRTAGLKSLESLVAALNRLLPPTSTCALPADLLNDLRRVISYLDAIKQHNLKSWLNQTSNKRYLKSLEARLDGTCLWILEKPEFKEWISTDFPVGSKILWIHGPAGFGKTVLCASIVKHISERLTTPIAYFFFSSGSAECEDPLQAVRSWIYQLANDNKEMLKRFPDYNEADVGLLSDPGKVLQLFEEIVNLRPGCTFVVDGLDECTQLDDIADFLRSLQHILYNAKNDSRLLVCSRSLFRIQETWKSNKQTAVTQYQIRSCDLKVDTELYAYSILATKLSENNSSDRSRLAAEMTERCQGQFLWLRLLGESIQPRMNPSRFRSLIENSPKKLDCLYDDSWRRILALHEVCQYRVMAILRWVVFAFRPLTVGEMIEAVLIIESGKLFLEDLPNSVDEEYINSEIVSICSPLLQVDGISTSPAELMSHLTVEATHSTVKEFLLRNIPVPDCFQGNGSAPVNGDCMQHTLLAQACLQYISDDRVWQTVKMESTAPQIEHFRAYAAKYWSHHMSRGQPANKETNKLAVQFLTEPSAALRAWKEFRERDSTPDYMEHYSLLLGNRETADDLLPSPLFYSVKLRLEGVVAALIGETYCDINMINSKGKSPLSIASWEGYDEIVALLLEKGADSTLADESGMLPIHLAAHRGHFDVVWRLSDHGNTINTLDISWKSPLHYAVLQNQQDCVRRLLVCGAEITADINNMTPIHYAVNQGNVDILDHLIKAGVPVDLRVKRQIWQAKQREGKYCYFPREGTTPNALKMETKNGQGLTALHYAALTGSSKMTEALLNRGADPNSVSEHGETPLHLVIKEDLQGPKYPDCWNDPCHRVEIVLDDIALEPEYDEQYSEVADWVKSERLKILDLLLCCPSINVNVQDCNGMTPLHLACSKGNFKAVDHILAHAADVTISDFKGLNALHYAAQKGDMDTIRCLITHAVTPGFFNLISSHDNSRRNALHYLLGGESETKLEALRVLLAERVSVTDLDDSGMSPLAFYLQQRCLPSDEVHQVAQLLLQYDSEPSFTTSDGRNLAHVYAASYVVSKEVLAVLRESGVDLKAQDNYGRTILHIGAIRGSLTEETVAYLRDHAGLNVDLEDAYGNTPRQYASELEMRVHPWGVLLPKCINPFSSLNV